MNNKLLVLLGVLLIACFFRFYQLSHVPPSASLDEASIGWNAYSIIQTGGDGYGRKFPIILRAYDDFRPALYVYLVIPFVKLLGLNVLAVRLPSVFLSIIAIISSYFLVKILFKDFKYKEYLSLFVSFLLAVSPWNIYISRLGHEANAGLAFSILGILFFLLSCKEKGKEWYLLLSAIWFALSFYTYQSEKIFVPLMVLFLSIIYFRELLRMRKIVLISFAAGALLTIPIFIASFSKDALIRLSGTSAFDLNNPLYYESAKRLLDAKNHGNIIGEIINNRLVTSIHIFLSGYVSHFNPLWIFINRGEYFKAPGVGLLNIWEAPFFAVGVLYLIIKKHFKNQKAIIFSWIGAALVAPAISTQAPHAMRVYNILPIPQIITGVGFISIFLLARKYIKSDFLKKTLFYLTLILIFLESAYFAKQYFIVFPKEESSSFQYALSEAMRFVLKYENSYNKIVFSNRRNLSQSYMFFLFYSKYSPTLYQKQGGTKSGGFEQVHSFGKFEFRRIDWSKDKKAKNTLFVGNITAFPADTGGKVFKNLNGEEVIKAVGK